VGGNADCAERFRFRVNGTGFLRTDSLACRFTAVADGREVFTHAQYLSAKQVDCDVPNTEGLTLAGAAKVAVTLDGQLYTPNAESPEIFFYEQPKAVQGDVGSLGSSLFRGFGVDPAKLPVDFRATTQSVQDKYYQLAPVKGGTPLVMYLAEAKFTGSVAAYSQRAKLTLRFGTCTSTCTPGLADSDRLGKACEYAKNELVEEQFCTCEAGPVVGVTLDGQAGAFNGKQVHKLSVETPAGVAAGKYMVCFSMDKVHYLPLRANAMGSTITFERTYFRFYPKPLVTGLSLSDGPTNLCGTTATNPATYVACTAGFFTVRVFGANFLQEADRSMCGSSLCSGVACTGGGGSTCNNCMFTEVGLCQSFAPSSASGVTGAVRIYVRVDGAGLQGPAIANYATVAVVSPHELTFKMPDVAAYAVASGTILTNISISFNGFDFSEMQKGVSEFNFFGFPRLQNFLPIWGHTDFATVITIRGSGFQNNPTMNKCVYSGASSTAGDPCANPFATSEPVPARFISSTEMECTVVARLKANPYDTTVYNKMCVRFSPDGRLSTKANSPELYELMMQPVGTDRFQFGQDIKSFNLSSNAIPIQGGIDYTFAIEALSLSGSAFVNNQAECMSLAAVHANRTLRVVFVPTIPQWADIRPPGYGPVIFATIKRIVENLKQIDLQDQINNICRVYVTVTLPVIPFPMLTELKLSYNGGQKYIGPASTVLAYRGELPNEVVPRRGSGSLSPRPQVSVFFSINLFSGKAPITGSQANALFKKTRGCVATNEVICQAGPQCRFILNGVVKQSEAIFEYDSTRPKLTCTAPISATGFSAVNVTFDTFLYLQSPAPFQFYLQPKAQNIYPTNGFWNAETELVVLGTNFLYDPEQIWCIFDFRDVFPLSDIWNVERKWSQGTFVSSTEVRCSAPPIPLDERPTVPRNPRARVGVIVDGQCLTYSVANADQPRRCTTLKNFDSALWSNAFFLYTSNPALTKVVPVAGFTRGGLKVTISGTGFMNAYTVGKPPGWKTGSLPTLGYATADMQKFCSSTDAAGVTTMIPCAALTCRFGDVSVQAVMDPTALFATCDTPTLPYPKITPLDLQVSLNGKALEFSNPVTFTYVTASIDSVSPLAGSADGGNKISVHGSEFFDVACVGGAATCPGLVCKFSRVDAILAQVIVAATFISENEAHCILPSNDDMGFSKTSVTTCTVQAGTCYGEIYVQLSVNGKEYTEKHGTAVYTYQAPATFTSFSPDAGSIVGSTNVTVVGTLLDVHEVQCMFGQTKVAARRVSSTRVICMAPPRTSAVVGGVFMGFSSNNVDFCELVVVGGQTQCQFTYATSPTATPFYYHDSMNTLNIFPPSGWRNGGTQVHVLGTGFTNYGQRLWIYFDGSSGTPAIPVLATIVNSTALKVLAPALPTNPAAIEPRKYVVDKVYPVQVSSNNETYTILQTGLRCPPNDAGENPRADCLDPFVQYMWYELPEITKIKLQTSGFYGGLSQPMYKDLKDFKDQPQGPVWGGTTVSIIGTGFTSWSRIQLRGGNAVTPNGCNGGTKQCTTTCKLPFVHTIQGSQYYYQCTNLKKSSEQINYNPEEYWCAVGDAATYSGQFGVCTDAVSIWKDYNQGGKAVTTLECRFGEKFVPAMVVDNQTISCVSPPSDTGTLVPLSVTLNREDFTAITDTTYFQYVKPPPSPEQAIVSTTGTEITVSFNTSTNMQGMLDLDRVMKAASPEDSGCTSMFHPSFVDTLGSVTKGPVCTYSPGGRSSVIITIGTNPTFQISDMVKFYPRACEAASQGCWHPRSQKDLLSAPELPETKCVYPHPFNSGCSNKLQWKANWCGHCVPRAGLNGEFIPPVELSYPLNNSITTLLLKAPLSPVVPFAQISGVSTNDDCSTACVGGTSVGIPCQPATCAANDLACDPGVVTTCLGGGRCLNVLTTLDGSSGTSGNLGRPFKQVVWSLDASKTTDMSFAQNLSMYKDLRAAFPTSKLISTLVTGANRTYCFKLTVVNWMLDAYTTPCFLVKQVRGVALPNTQIIAPSTTKLSKDLFIEGESGSSSCLAEGAFFSMNYSWTVSPQPPGWSAVRTDAISLTIPRYSIAWDTSVAYSFSLVVFLTASGSTSSVITTLGGVRMAATKPSADIAGGSRTISSLRALTLDATKSNDPDVVLTARVTSDLVYCWACTVSGAACAGLTPPARDAAVWDIPAPHAAGKRTFTLHVARVAGAGTCAAIRSLTSADLTSAHMSVVIEVVKVLVSDDPLPVVQVQFPDVAYLSYAQSTVLRGFVSQGSDACNTPNPSAVACSVAYKWEFDPPLSSELATTAGTSFGVISLKVPELYFEKQDGLSYSISLRATYGGKSAAAKLQMNVNLGPVGGKLTVSPSSGLALVDTFILSAKDWSDADLPLQYKFSIDQYSNKGVMRMDLGPAQTSSQMLVELPPGNPDDNNRLATYVVVIDALGAETLLPPPPPKASSAAAATTATMFQVVSELRGLKSTDIKAAAELKVTKLLASGDSIAVMQQLSLVGAAAGHPDLAGQAQALQGLKDFIVATMGAVLDSRALKGGRRRLLDFAESSCPLNPDLPAVVSGYSFIATSGGSTGNCAEGIGRIHLEAGCSSSIGTQRDTILQIVANCQKGDFNATKTYTQLNELVRYVGLLTMANRGEDSVSFESPSDANELKSSDEGGAWELEYFKLHLQRLSTTLSAPAAVSFSEAIGNTGNFLKIPTTMTLPDADSFDVAIISWARNFNLRAASVNTTLNSRVLSVAFRAGQPNVLAQAAGHYSDFALPTGDAARFSVRLFNDVTVSRSATTDAASGVYHSSVCALYNQTQNKWIQFGTAIKASGGPLTCSSPGLSEFALIEGLVGCDGLASSAPAVNNECGACNGGEPQARQGICDWNTVPCVTGRLDRCHVCNGLNKSFASMATINQSGSCNWLGETCPPHSDSGAMQFPNRCGKCDLKGNQGDRGVNSGICDCENGGQPNGVKKMDRCNICGGTNSTMDYCGRNSDIPAEDVCWGGGFDTVQAGNVANFSCRGCDGVPRPDLPYTKATKVGGVREDQCGVCGGTGSTCYGCDKKPGSSKKFDACGKCLDPADKNILAYDVKTWNVSKFNGSCVGCDKVPRVEPRQLDHNGVCGGDFFGVRGCNYETFKPLDAVGSRACVKVCCNADCNAQNPALSPDLLASCKAGCDNGPTALSNDCTDGCDPCTWDCNGEHSKTKTGATYDKCGVCGGDGSTCDKGAHLLDDWTLNTACKAKVFVDKCGKCGGDNTTCWGCDKSSFSGKVKDACGKCDGDGASCKGCDGVINSGKKLDACGKCDGKDVDRDVCGVCDGNGDSCAGCDRIPYSGKAMDACGKCGGTNRCKWRDGFPPAESGGSTDAVVLLVPLDLQAPEGVRRSAEEEEGVRSDESDAERSVEAGAGGGAKSVLWSKGAATGLAMLVASLLGVLFVSRFRA